MRLAYLPFFRYRAIRPTGNCSNQKIVLESLLAECTRFNKYQNTSCSCLSRVHKIQQTADCFMLLSEHVSVAIYEQLTCRPALVDLLTDFLPEALPFPRPLMVA